VEKQVKVDKEKVLGKTNRLFPFHTSWTNSTILVLLLCIRCSGNVFTEPLPSNDKRICTERHKLVRGIYEVRRSNGLRFQDIRTKFRIDWFRHSKVNMEDTHTDTDRKEIAEVYFHFLRLKKVG
jgi:hypothetical protein